EQQRSHASYGDHVGVFGHEVAGKLHGAILGVVSRDQFGFSFRQVKWNAIGFRIGGNQVNEEADELPVKNIPARNEAQESASLGIDNRAQAETARLNDDADEGKSQPNFITDHLRGGSEPAQQRIF